MPGGNRTGPMGAGPMTGRGMGFCVGAATPGYMNPSFGYGRGMGRGMGRGRGWGRGFGWGAGYYGMASGPAPYPAANPAVDVNILKNEAQALQEELNLINKRIQEMESAQDNNPKS